MGKNQSHTAHNTIGYPVDTMKIKTHIYTNTYKYGIKPELALNRKTKHLPLLSRFGFWNHRRRFLFSFLFFFALLMALAAVSLDLPPLLGPDEVASAPRDEKIIIHLQQASTRIGKTTLEET